MDSTSLIIGLFIGVFLGAVICALLLKRQHARARSAVIEQGELRHQNDIADIRAVEERAKSFLREELASAQATNLTLREQLAGSQRQQQEALERERSESKVLQALAPVQETLVAMQNKVNHLESQRSQQHGEITEQLKAAAQSEERIRAAAESLTSAMRSTNSRGIWGETQLRRLVEAAGLIEKVDFDTQMSIKSDSGSGRPDMVIHLPGGKNIAVDSKAPFENYFQATQIPDHATEIELARRESLIKLHVKSVRDHIKTLGSKSYWNGLDASPEIVVAFIPNDATLAAAVGADPTLLEYGYSNNVAIVSPVSLWAVLKAIAFTWRQDVITDEALELFDLTKELHSRLRTTATYVENMGKGIERAVENYNKLVGSLERGVLPTVRKLHAIDQEKIGELKAIESTTRQLSAPELTTDELEAAPPRAKKRSKKSGATINVTTDNEIADDSYDSEFSAEEITSVDTINESEDLDD